MEKILLILDLDETLIHATREKIHDNFDFKIFNYFVYKRPFLQEFITTCAEHFQLAVWSSASDDYVAEIVQKIFPKAIQLAFVWGRSHCTPVLSPQIDEYGCYNLDETSHYDYVKILKKVKKLGFHLDKTLIVDDTRAKVANSFGNAIYPTPYNGDPNDTELMQLSVYLLSLKDSENVRKIEKRFWKKHLSIS
jgi:carboxy-terminal domain RNA polymerase II polypeptide A small phosphatase